MATSSYQNPNDKRIVNQLVGPQSTSQPKDYGR